MNILFLTTHINTGGISSYLRTLSKGLIKRHHRVVIVSSGGDTENDFLKMGAQVKVLNIKTKSELDPRIYMALKPISNMIQEHKIDIIHSHTRITQVMGHILGKKNSTPYVSTCHGFFRKNFGRVLWPCWGDKVIAISQAVQEHLEKDFKVTKEKIALVESGVDLDDFLMINAEKKMLLRKDYGFGDEPLVGIIARLSNVKGQDVLITAMKRVVQTIPQAKLLIVGDGKWESTLKNMVKTFNLEGSVLFYPVVNQTSRFLSILDVFVMPSRQEGLGLSIMEAQAMGLPVVASKVGGIPSLIEDGKTGLLVEPENTEQLAEKIVQVLRDKVQAQRIGLSARKFIQENYSAETMVEKTLKVYESLAGKKR